MPRGKKANQPEELDVGPSYGRVIDLIDEEVQKRHKLELARRTSTKRIVELAAEARRLGAGQELVAKSVKRTDKNGKLAPISRQALNTMIATYENRREPRTTRASRRRQSTETPAGTLNTEVFG